MRLTLTVFALSFALASSAVAQSGGGASSAGSTGSNAGGTTTTTGVSPGGAGANSPTAPATINQQLRTRSGSDLQTPPSGTVGTTGNATTSPPFVSGQIHAGRSCAVADCSSPLQGRYMNLVDSMARIAGVPVPHKANRRTND